MIKKYKLIKKYPESEFLGFTVTDENCTGCYKGILGDDIIIFRKEDIENYPEFWKPVLEKEFEILEFKYLDNNFYYEYSFVEADRHVFSSISGKFILDDTSISTVEITKIRRISDGVEFSIGDLCYPKSKPLNCGKITSFEFCKAGYFRISNESKYYIGINDVVKSKKPLFTTFDGKDIYPEDSYWCVNTSPHLWSLFEQTSRERTQLNKTVIAFSTKEVAQEYIEENKPKYSKKQILDIIENNFMFEEEAVEELLKLIK